jgi:hypothetical protein
LSTGGTAEHSHNKFILLMRYSYAHSSGMQNRFYHWCQPLKNTKNEIVGGVKK